MTRSELKIKGETFLLDYERALFWKVKKTLIVSDVHLGKAGHFRKHGIPISAAIHQDDLRRLDGLIETYRPQKVLFLGDLFHSDWNNEWKLVTQWLKNRGGIQFNLIRGNHDILEPAHYNLPNLEIMDEWIEAPFSFTHEQQTTGDFNFSGHVHPGVRIRGKAKQGFTLPCLFVGQDHAILPAFGNFTGYVRLKPVKGDRVYAIADREIIALMF